MLGALSIAAFALSLFAAFGWLLYVVHPWFRRWWVRVLFGCVLFVWGFTTFFYFPVESSDADDFTARILRATNRTSMTMIAKGRAYGKPLSLSARVNYGAFQTAVIFYMAAILLSIFGRTAMNNLQKLFVMHEDLLHVFWGLSERDRLLARSIHTAVPETRIEFNLPKSVMYNPLEQARLTDLADELGAFWTFVNLPPKQSQQASAGKSAALSRRFYRRLVSVLSDWFALSVTKGRYHYFLGDDGHANMAMAQSLAERIIDNDFAYGEWRFFVRAGNIDNEGLFMAWAEGVYKKTGKMVSVSVVRDAELIARDFVSRFPPISFPGLTLHPDTATVEGVCRTLLLGFDRAGREFLSVNLCISGFVGPDGKTISRFPFTVVDRKRERWERFLLSAPEIAARLDEYGLSYEQMQVGMEQFETWFRRNHASFDRIVFCMDDDSVNIRECLRVSDILKEQFERRHVELFVRIENPRLANVLTLNEASNDNVSIEIFGDLKRLYSYSSFHADEIDDLAAAINWRWNLISEGVYQCVDWNRRFGKLFRQDLKDDMKRYWSEAGVYNRRSSQILALRCLTFCRVWGIELRPDIKLGHGRLVLVDVGGNEDGTRSRRVAYEVFREKINIAKNRDVLARMEHHRWSTYMRVCGYRSFDGAQEELLQLKKDGAFVLNQTQKWRRHAGLVEFDPLCDEQVKRCEMGWKVLIDAAAVAGLCDPPKNMTLEPQEVRSDDNPSDVSYQALAECPDKKMVARCAMYADIYLDGQNRCDGVESSPAVKFLESDEIRVFQSLATEDGTRDVFWFEDVVSPHFGLKRRRRFKTRFAYVYERATGMIKPLDAFPRAFRREVCGAMGMDERLVDFKSQPHFIARVTQERMSSDSKTDCPIVVSYCGTKRLSRKDWTENTMQLFGKTPPQFRLAASLLKAVCMTYSNKDVIVVGHSEGGGEVQYSLMRNAAWQWCNSKRKISGYTFNSQRLSKLILEELDYANIRSMVSRMIVNVRVASDIVSGCWRLGERLIGGNVTLPGRVYARPLNRFQKCKELLRAHSIKSIIKELNGACDEEGGCVEKSADKV